MLLFLSLLIFVCDFIPIVIVTVIFNIIVFIPVSLWLLMWSYFHYSCSSLLTIVLLIIIIISTPSSVAIAVIVIIISLIIFTPHISLVALVI